MKKPTKIFLIVVSFAALVQINSATAIIRYIEVSNFAFSPSTLFASTGDTIKWIWINGSHSTTCDGSIGTSRPVGAASWNQNLNAAFTTFTYIPTVGGTYNYKCTPHYPNMLGTINVLATSVNQISSLVPDNYVLYQNYPNPFNPITNIKFDIVNNGFTRLSVINSIGQTVAVLVAEDLSSGNYELSWDATIESSGIYFYKLETGDFIDVKRMILIK